MLPQISRKFSLKKFYVPGSLQKQLVHLQVKQKPWTILLSQPWTYHSSRVLGANSSATSTIVHREGSAGPVWRLPNSSDDRKWAETYLWSMWGGRRWNLSVMTWIVFRPDLSCWWKFCLEKNLVWSRICLEYSGSMWLCTHSFAAKGKSWFGHLEANCSYWVSWTPWEYIFHFWG